MSGVTDMSSMFYPATYFNQDLSAWDVSAVTDMSQMFAYAKAFDQALNPSALTLPHLHPP